MALTLAGGITLVVILAALALLMSDRAPPDMVLLGAVFVLVAAGVLSPSRAVAGFSNPGMLTVAALFVVAAGLRETGAVAQITQRMLGRPATERGAIARLVAPVMLASALLNNTAIVATMLPAVHDWSRRLGVSASRLLMPLSFASILGGTITLVGTSTNLVVAGLVSAELPKRSDLVEIGLFDITPLGLTASVLGGLAMVTLGPWLLPSRQPAVSAADDPRRYTMEAMVAPGGRLVGKTIEEAGLRHLPGAFLMEIVREGHIFPAVDAQVRLEARDRMVFVGDVDGMVDLLRMPGVLAAQGQAFRLSGDRMVRRIVEAVVAHRNPLVGRTIREGRFRARYHAVVIAVARGGEHLPGRIGDIALRPGDVLLLEAHPDFLAAQRARGDFYLVSSVTGANPPRFDRAPIAIGILALLVAAITLGLADTLLAAALGGGAMVLSRCCTVEEARRSLDLQVLVAIAAAFGLGAAMQDSGLDRLIAELVVGAGASSPMLALIALYLVTALLTEIITNNAAAVLAFPVALALADRVDAEPMGYVFAVMMAASASFLTPIGYQTNLMVYNLGGYKAFDYPRFGLPLSIVAAATTLALVPWLWPL